ncbi:unnamed protein product [Pleuronectes platessa]|uniref:Uncharacterized protein n=1 Tax=Pleuronectes platessa TaxID=8262 RepID=A0A9N7VCM4_PLEPL|nr:unnamed protein product [Pleuronectes platessa]
MAPDSAKTVKVIMRDHTSGANVEDLLRQSQMELQWIQRQLAMIAARNVHHHHLHSKAKPLPHIQQEVMSELPVSHECVTIPIFDAAPVTEALAAPSLRYEVSSQQAAGHSVQTGNRFRLLEERNRALKLEVTTLRQEKLQYKKLQLARSDGRPRDDDDVGCPSAKGDNV